MSYDVGDDHETREMVMTMIIVITMMTIIIIRAILRFGRVLSIKHNDKSLCF